VVPHQGERYALPDRAAGETEYEVSDVNKCKSQELLAERFRRTDLSFHWHHDTARRLGRLNRPLAKIYVSHWMSTSGAACLAVAILLGLGGCTAVKVKLGMRVYLDKTHVADLRAGEFTRYFQRRPAWAHWTRDEFREDLRRGVAGSGQANRCP
jgi:hypothetical protein